MHATKGALVRAERVIDLTNMRRKTMLTKFLLTKRAGEKTSFVGLLIKLNQICAREWCGIKEHRCKLSYVSRQGLRYTFQ